MALETAFSRSPELLGRDAAVKEVEGSLLGAQTRPFNPELELELADRQGSVSSTSDHRLSLSQEFEIFGQRDKRVAVADKALAAARADFERDKQVLAFRVESAFAEAVRERELLDVFEIDATLAREMLAFSERRLERGVATQIEVNLAQASAGRAERSVRRARATYATACSRLAEVAGVEPTVQPEPNGKLVFPNTELPPLTQLTALAVQNRADLNSARYLKEAGAADIQLALAERGPNLELGAFAAREESADDLLGVTVGVSLPIFNRNQGRIAESLATRERLQHEYRAQELAIEQEVVAARNDLLAAQQAAEFLRELVLGTLEENVDLLQRSFAAGRIGATDVVAFRREFVASRREYIEVLADAWLASAQLNLATGVRAVGEDVR